MGDEAMQEYDSTQRAAICHQAWRDKDKEHAAASEVRDGLVRIPIAYTGDFKQGDKRFTITAADLRDMRRNMARRETPLDYEHLSAAAGSAPGHTRAAGWLKPLTGDIEEFGEGREILWGWAEFTPACLAAIRSKEFRYLSPEIHWKSKDETGKALGTRLAAAAITNRPFLKDLPPIEIASSAYPGLLERVAMSESIRLAELIDLIDAESVHVPGDIAAPAKEGKEVFAMKQFKLKKLTDGEHAGKFGVYDGTALVGLCDLPEDLRTAAADSGAIEQMSAIETQRAETACLLEFARVPSHQLLSKAREFSAAGKLNFDAFLRVQEVNQLLTEAVNNGKILPKQRETLFSLAIADYAHVAAYLSELKPVVDLSTRGISGDGSALTARQEMDARIRAYMTDHKEARYAEALSAVTRADPDFYEHYKTECATLTDR
jgi:phage I-like protein